MSATGHDLPRLERLAAGELDGGERAELLRHVEACEECRSWLGTYRLLTEGLAGARAAGHPSSEQLARYCVEPDSLTEAERVWIAAHLADCGECEREAGLTSWALGKRRGTKLLAFPTRVKIRWRPAVQKLAAAGVLLAAILGYTLSRVEVPEPAARKLAGSHLTGARVVNASESITATSTTIETGGDVTFRAGETVVLGDGFSIGENASFRVEIVQSALRPADESTGPPAHGGIDSEQSPLVRNS